MHNVTTLFTEFGPSQANQAKNIPESPKYYNTKLSFSCLNNEIGMTVKIAKITSGNRVKLLVVVSILIFSKFFKNQGKS